MVGRDGPGGGGSGSAALTPSGRGGTRGAAPAPDRAPVAVLLSRFPVVTQTFILRELDELERQGTSVVLVALARGRDRVVHPLALPWSERAIRPRIGFGMVIENLRVLARRPILYLSTLAALMWEMRRRPRTLLGTLVVYPAAVWLGRRLRELGARHVHAHFAAHAATAALVASTVHAGGPDLPFSVTVHAYDIFLHQEGLARKLGRASFVRSISEFNVGFLRDRLGAGAPLSQRLRVIHCGVDPGAYRRRPPEGRAGIDRPLRVLCVASLRPFKGVNHLVEAVRRLRAQGVDLECEIVGDGELRAELDRHIASSGLGHRLRLVGNLPEAEVAERLSRADLFVLPSVVSPDGNMEGIPVSLMEAMASSLPVVSTQTSGIPELVVEGETGTLVPPGDPDALARAIREVLDDPGAARGRAAAGRRKVEEEFALERCVRRLAAEIDAHSLPDPPGARLDVGESG